MYSLMLLLGRVPSFLQFSAQALRSTYIIVWCKRLDQINSGAELLRSFLRAYMDSKLMLQQARGA